MQCYLEPATTSLPYCPEQAPMGARSSSTKIWEWAVTRRRCLNGSTIPEQGPTPHVKLAKFRAAREERCEPGHRQVCESDVVAPKAHQSYVSSAGLPSDSLRKNLAWWAVTRRTLNNHKTVKSGGGHLLGTIRYLHSFPSFGAGLGLGTGLIDSEQFNCGI